jgi:hypothetical protein
MYRRSFGALFDASRLWIDWYGANRLYFQSFLQKTGSKRGKRLTNGSKASINRVDARRIKMRAKNIREIN